MADERVFISVLLYQTHLMNFSHLICGITREISTFLLAFRSDFSACFLDGSFTVNLSDCLLYVNLSKASHFIRIFFFRVRNTSINLEKARVKSFQNFFRLIDRRFFSFSPLLCLCHFITNFDLQKKV